MNALNLHKSESKYAAGYIKNIRETYLQHHETLKEIANTPPPENPSTSETLDLLEYRMLKSQEKLLQVGSQVRPSNLEDVSELLELWHYAAISSVAPEDVRPADALVLVAYNYIKAAQPL